VLLINTPEASPARAGSQAIKVCEQSFLEGARVREEPKPEAHGLVRGRGGVP
jgi:hypothetical protein